MQQVKISKTLALRNTEAAVGIKFGGNRGKWACHIGLLVPHNAPIFHSCPRLRSKDLIALRHQSGIFRNKSEFIGMYEKGKNSKKRFVFPRGRSWIQVSEKPVLRPPGKEINRSE
jgi:hypothetical protein